MFDVTCFNFRVQQNSTAKVTCAESIKQQAHKSLHRKFRYENDADHPEEDFEYWNISRDIDELFDSAEEVTPGSLTSKRSDKRCSMAEAST